MQLRDLIRNYRTTHGLSQRQFATQCDLSNGYISILEKGLNPNTGKPVTPTIPQLKKLANGMSMTLAELFEQVDDMPIDISFPDISINTDKCADDNYNIIKIAGRDGSYRERRLTDQQMEALNLILDQMPDVPEDL